MCTFVRSQFVLMVSISCLIAFGCAEPVPLELGRSVEIDREPLAQIQRPVPGEIIMDDVFHGMKGVAFDIPSDQKLVVFATDPDHFNYFLMFPFPRFNARNHIFEQNNIRLASPGDGWELHICAATDEAVRYLSSCAQRGEWSFPNLVDGIVILDTVRVERRTQ